MKLSEQTTPQAADLTVPASRDFKLKALFAESIRLFAVAILAATTTLSINTYAQQEMASSQPTYEATEVEDPSALDTMIVSDYAPTHSLRPQIRPSNILEAVTQVPTTMNASVVMVNQKAIRNLPITDSLREKISTAVGVVYGPGYTAQVYSGGQHDHETAARLGVRRVGTRAHDHGHAADIYIVDGNGERLIGNALAPLGQFWLASGFGGVGLEMRGGGIHLDEGRVRFWDYSNDGGSVTKVQLDALVAGKRREMPVIKTLKSQGP